MTNETEEELIEKEKADIVAIEEMVIAARMQENKTREEMPDITSVRGKGYFVNKIKDYVTWIGRHKELAGAAALLVVASFYFSWPYLTKRFRKTIEEKKIEIAEKKQALEKTEMVLSSTTKTLEGKIKEADEFSKKFVQKEDYAKGLERTLEEQKKQIEQFKKMPAYNESAYDTLYGVTDPGLKFYVAFDTEEKSLYVLSEYGEKSQYDKDMYIARIVIANIIKEKTGKISEEELREIKRGELDVMIKGKKLYLGNKEITLNDSERKKIFKYFEKK